MELFRIGFIPVGVIDLVDVCLVALIFYRVYKTLRNSALLQLLVLMMLIFVVWRVVEVLHMELMNTLVRQFLQIGTLALVVIYAPELRRVFMGLRRNSVLEKLRRQINKGIPLEDDFVEIVGAVMQMGRSRTGSIIVLEGRARLDTFATTGDELNADLSQRLLESIFNPKSPLHDGAVIVRGKSIIAARVVLPVSDDPDLPPELGLRHRSGLGITEVTDSAALITSEESGKVSVAYEGRLKRNVQEEELKQFLRNFYDQEVTK